MPGREFANEIEIGKTSRKNIVSVFVVLFIANIRSNQSRDVLSGKKKEINAFEIFICRLWTQIFL
jgi:hypothetical protein